MENVLLFERDGSVARLTLNRPESGNALNMDMARALMNAAIECDADDSVRCVLLTAKGRLFCAGGDVAEFSKQEDALQAFLKEISGYLHLAISRFMRMSKPVVTAVNGPAAGAGIGLAAFADIVLVDPGAHFTSAYTGLGLSPDGATTWLLPRLIGLRHTQEFLLRNRRMSADEAAALGLVTRVIKPPLILQDEAAALAHELAHSATAALGQTRRLLLDSFSTQVETQMELESRAISSLAPTGEAQAGLAAFVKGQRSENKKRNQHG
ncbi:enoyl-CoA hydratase/isomerase family protein [Alcaligenaceae bacterium]|nr:enoyl-CoA hydratase/isomerase family protein [Alcaligenaceae bacterium]